MIEIFNDSPVGQSRWETIRVPARLFKDSDKGKGSNYEHGALVVGGKIGEHLRRVHIFGKLEGYEIGTLGGNGADLKYLTDVALPGGPIPRINVDCKVGEEELAFSLAGGRTIYSDDVMRQVYSKMRANRSLFLFEAHTLTWSNSLVHRIELVISASNPAVPQVEEEIRDLVVSTPGYLVVPRWAKYRQVERIAPDAVRLIGTPDSFGDGQRQIYVFDVVELSPNLDIEATAGVPHGSVFGVAHRMIWDGEYGPFGQIPELNDYENTKAREWGAAAAREQWQSWQHRKNAVSDRWAEPHLGLTKTPFRTGDQQDFGMAKVQEVVASHQGVMNLDEAYCQALQDGCRPNCYRESNGDAVLPINHPGLVFWGDQKHYHPGVSPDRLGKELPAIEQCHGWWGRDWEHGTCTYMAGVAALVESPALDALLNDYGRAYLFGATVKPGWSTSSRGPARAVGRQLHAMSWIHWLYGDPAIAERMGDRVGSFSDYEEKLGEKAEDQGVR